MGEQTVGLIGLGIMGSAIATNLVDRGWTVYGHDINAERCHENATNGVKILSSPQDVCRAATIIMTSLPSASAAQVVAHAIASADVATRTVVELSTLALDDKLQFADTLTAAGHIALDCPISGTGAQAQSRDLLVYASGDPAAITRCQPLFADFARSSADLGVYGNGSRMKFIANHLVAIHNVAAAEAMVLADHAGLNLDQVIEMVGDGAGGSRMFQMRAPLMAARTYQPATMRVATWQKDMAIIAGFAAGLRCDTPLFEATKDIYDRAHAAGFGDQDTASVHEVLSW